MINTSKNIVKLKEWISIGEIDAVVCKIYENDHNKVEVVYFNGSKPSNKFAYYINDEWSFGINEQYAGYAENYSRLAEYVTILKSGRY